MARNTNIERLLLAWLLIILPYRSQWTLPDRASQARQPCADVQFASAAELGRASHRSHALLRGASRQQIPLQASPFQSRHRAGYSVASFIPRFDAPDPQAPPMQFHGCPPLRGADIFHPPV
jgi:hypothetical protein